MTAFIDTILSAVAPSQTIRPSPGQAGALKSVFLQWAERRRQRRALARLNDEHLRDIGLRRADADLESSKPFWRE